LHDVQTILDALTSGGFVVGEQTTAGAFDDQSLTLTAGELSATLLQDRGRTALTVWPTAAPDVDYDVALWARWLGHPDAADLDEDVTAQATHLVAHLQTLRQAVQAADGAEMKARLVALGTARTLQRLGLPRPA
jgi:hypothetical protein